MMKEDPERKEKILVGLKKARSHIEKVTEMVEDDAYCIEVIQQILAVQGLLKSAQSQVLESHLKSCFKRGMAGKSERTKKRLIEEISQVTKMGN